MEHSAAHFAAEAADLAEAHRAHNFEQLVTPSGHHILETLDAPGDVEVVGDGAGVGGGFVLTFEASLEGDEKGGIDDDGIEAGDNRFGNMFGGDDATTAEKGDLVAGAVIDEMVMGLADEVEDESAIGGLAVVVGGEVEDTDTSAVGGGDCFEVGEGEAEGDVGVGELLLDSGV